MVVLRDNTVRDTFQEQGGVAILARLCDPQSGEIQRLYEVCFCLWVLSYNEKAVEEFGQAYVVEKFCEIVKGNFREKYQGGSRTAGKCCNEAKRRALPNYDRK